MGQPGMPPPHSSMAGPPRPGMQPAGPPAPYGAVPSSMASGPHMGQPGPPGMGMPPRPGMMPPPGPGGPPNQYGGQPGAGGYPGQPGGQPGFPQQPMAPQQPAAPRRLDPDQMPSPVSQQQGLVKVISMDYCKKDVTPVR